MKYLSVALVLGLMIWTWSLKSVDLVSHKALELEFEQIIRADIAEKNPQVTEVRFSQMYPEVLKPQVEILLHFRYHYVEPAAGAEDVTEQTMQGTALLKSSDGGKTWTRQSVELNAPSVTFQRGVKVTPEPAQAGEKPAAQPEGTTHD